MTIEIFRDRKDAGDQAYQLAVFHKTSYQVIKVKIDQSQAPIYGFRYIGSNYEILDNLEYGFIVLSEDWTAKEAAECGLVQEEL